MADELQRVDINPTDHIQGYDLRPGKPLPFGATIVPGGVNFSIYSSAATSCTLVLFDKGEPTPKVEIPFPDAYRIGSVYSMVVFGLDCENIEYGFRMSGPHDPAAGHRFDESKILLDPYAKAIGGRDRWGDTPDWDDVCQYRGRLAFDDFDWEADRPLETPIEDLVVYEMHVRGFTKHASSGVRHPGTYAAIREKIPYLKHLGINCVEFLPVFEFDEFEGNRTTADGRLLLNYWGYSTVGFFAPKAAYAATGHLGMQVDEFKALVKELHANGIEVILDVVFNHTAEGNEQGPTFSFRGIDNKTYYMLTPEGYYWNFSGTGNTLNCNHPIVRNMVLDCLRHWASEYHIDGFRFDLAAILGRDPSGIPLSNPPLVEALAYDPILAKCKLIAEAWDAGGLYQVGSFPAYGRWAEWNGRYRDDMRQFLKGDLGMVGAAAQAVEGSPNLYAWRGASATVNFFCCHDGFTLADLVSYNDKHNDANGWGNTDGGNDDHSWNCGAEGPTDDPGVLALRQQQMKNAFALLLTSRGVPMFLMGDEVARSQQGNNNTYCQDGEINWFDWTQVDQNADLRGFVENCLAFRHAHPVLRSAQHFRHTDYLGSGYPDISWHGTQAWQADWSGTSRVLAFMLCGRHAKEGTASDENIYVAANMYWESLTFELPRPPEGTRWHQFANTGAVPSSYSPGTEPALENDREIQIGAHSVVVLVAR